MTSPTSPASQLHVIAEAGTNHNARPETARSLVDVAAASGADSAKFQIIYPEGLYLPEFYQDGRYLPNEVFEKRRAGMLQDDDWRTVAKYAAAKPLPLSASVFDRRGLDLLDELNAPYIKIASCDLNNIPLLKDAASRGKRLLVSTGMSTLQEIDRSVEAIRGAGNCPLVLFHCVSIYPCKLERTNLGFIDVLRQKFSLPVGFSDHTESSLAAAIAVSKGATWIEKHITLDRTSPGFDHAYAMEPSAFAAYVADLRSAETACRSTADKLSSDESKVRLRARRSIYAARDLKPGEILKAADVLVVRPEGPLVPGDLDKVVGRAVTQPIKKFDAVNWERLAS